MWSGSRRVRSTGMELRQPPPCRTSPFRKKRMARSSSGWNKSPMSNIAPVNKGHLNEQKTSVKRYSWRPPFQNQRNLDHRNREKIRAHDLTANLVRVGGWQVVPVAGERVGYTVVQECAEEALDADRSGRGRSRRAGCSCQRHRTGEVCGRKIPR